MNELLGTKRGRRAMVLVLALFTAVVILACSCPLSNLTQLATEIVPTNTPVVALVTPKPTKPIAPSPTPTYTPVPGPGPADMIMHTNEDAGFSIQYPADWFVESDLEGSYFAQAESGLVLMDPSDGPIFAMFAGSLTDIEADVGTIESVEQLMNALVSEEGFIPEGGEVGDYESLRPDVIVAPAQWVDDYSEQLWHVLLGVTLSGERAGVMAGITIAEDWETDLDLFRVMAQSVELFEPSE
ncbi:MAG: hypothetical protein H5T62_11260 [Anaerolineae bacterium]|nr:hypothetical protein [Anaerolineae bacterium]